MILIIGLGNPGVRYNKTRHNIGQRIVDGLRERWKNYNFSDWKTETKFRSKISISGTEKERTILAKPTTYMNNSGSAIALLREYYRIKPENILVVHDDIDLAVGSIRIAVNKGTAGHKGVASIVEHLKTKKFIRLRVGICPQKGKSRNVDKFVLKKFNRQEEQTLGETEERIYQAIETVLKDGIESAMNQFN